MRALRVVIAVLALTPPAFAVAQEAAIAGAVTGAFTGTVIGGPLGGVIGAAAGAVVGGVAQANLHPVSIEKVNIPRIWSLVTCVKD